MGLIAKLNAFNQRHPFSHNDFYAPWVARKLASVEGPHVIDVGCGTGNLLTWLRPHFDRVTGLEPDPATALIAARRFDPVASVGIRNLTLDDVAAPGAYSAITLVAVLHHLPLDSALKTVKSMLSPGGRLVIVGCYREEATTADRAASLVSLLANPVVGFLKHPEVASTPSEVVAPRTTPTESLSQIRRAADEHLGDFRMRRRLFWRYTLVYDKPA